MHQVVMDRLSAPQGSEVHLEIFDQALNIDPTNEDIVIFYVQNSGSESVSFTNGTKPNQAASDFRTDQGATLQSAAATKGGQYIAETMNFGDNGVLINKLRHQWRW